ncbi:MAG: hypothetical protein ABSG56_00590 [Bryobacteraceae bacterium]|jgi:hypothetical protein
MKPRFSHFLALVPAPIMPAPPSTRREVRSCHPARASRGLAGAMDGFDERKILELAD